MADESTILFIYGTLRTGGSNAFRMDGSRWISAATVRGRLYHISWYPGLVLDPDAGGIIGEIREVSANQLASLDEFEGAEYRRVSTIATLPDGSRIDVHVWEFLPEISESQRIASGDWFDVAIP